jgi:hypothetical protein
MSEPDRIHPPTTSLVTYLRPSNRSDVSAEQLSATERAPASPIRFPLCTMAAREGGGEGVVMSRALLQYCRARFVPGAALRAWRTNAIFTGSGLSRFLPLAYPNH